MPYYMKRLPLPPACQYVLANQRIPCSRTASHYVMSPENQQMGAYCTTHAQIRTKGFNDQLEARLNAS